jgi:SNF2 family DNA or RNA helicase
VIVLHAAWLARESELALWAEDAAGPRTNPPRRGRRPKKPSAEPHPFALDADGISLAAGELAGFDAQHLLAKGRQVELFLRLPEVDGGPAGSPWIEDDLLERDPKDPSPTPPERSWTIPSILLEPADAALLVAGLVGPEPSWTISDPAGVATAYDLKFAARSAEVALELITRGRMLPTLERSTDGWHARWRPLIGAQDRGRIQAMRWCAPLSFFAADTVDADADAGTLPTTSPDELDGMFRSYLWCISDSLARRFVSDTPSPPKLAGRMRTDPKTVTADAWLAALRSPDAKVATDEDDLMPLADVLAAWHATESADSDPVRTCFRIVPPAEDHEDDEDPYDYLEDEDSPALAQDEEDEDAWRIEFALQAVDDPSLLVSADSVWADGAELTALERHVTHPDEHLLKGLGRAARLVPSLGPALAAAEPRRQVTDAAGALSFLRDGAPVLEQAGFGILAPGWWRSSRGRLGLKLKAKTKSTKAPGGVQNNAIGLEGLCDIKWEAVLGDDPISLTELRQLAKLKQPLVRIRGQWVEMQAGDIEAAIAAVTSTGKNGKDTNGKGNLRELTTGEVMRTALGVDGIEAITAALPVTKVEADGWLGDLLAGADDHRLTARGTPETFEGRLRPYQERGLGWLAFLGDLGLGACLADDMGLGKTAQLLALLLDEKAQPKQPNQPKQPKQPKQPRGPALVICPMSLVGNWQREAARFAPTLSVYVHHGPDRMSGKEFTRNAKRADLVLSTYGLAARDQELLSTVTWSRLVLDEAQQIKNSAARTTRSVRAIPAHHRIAMTGTPVENRLSELWSIMQFLNPGLLGSEKGFRERFTIPIERDGDDEAAERLRRITGPFVLRRLKTDRSIIRDLPDKLEMKEFCTLTREQASLYQAVVDDMLARIEEAEGIERRGLVLATMLKLKQVCNHPAHFLADGSSLQGRSGKLTRLTDLLEEAVSEGDRALVFTQFVEMGNLLERHLLRHLGCDVLWLHGGVPKKSRDKLVQQFQEGHGPAVFLLSLKAGGTGLNLTAATHVVHFDRWWNPAVEDQATDRAFRIGQKRNVQVRKLVCGGTLEERIDEMIERKRALAERIVGTGEGWITEMSTDQLRQIISLSAESVGDD